MNISPVMLRYEGEGEFKPASDHWSRLSDKQFTIGEVYRLVPHEDRSLASHRGYFAQIRDAWQNLPEDLQERFPSEEHLRKYALIRCGYCESQTLVCDSEDAAKRTAQFIRPVAEFSVLTVSGNVVTRYDAQSQNMRSMDKAAFQKSKEDVLAFIASMIGTTAKELQAAGAQSEVGKR